MRKGERRPRRVRAGAVVWKRCRCGCCEVWHGDGAIEGREVVVAAPTREEQVFAELAASDLQSKRLAAGVATLMTADVSWRAWVAVEGVGEKVWVVKLVAASSRLL